MNNFVVDVEYDVEYDGDSESGVERRTERRMSGDKIIETAESELSRGEFCDPCMPSATLSALTPLPTKDVCSDRSRASISAAITVSKLQAVFAEKTAADMEQIVSWYNR